MIAYCVIAAVVSGIALAPMVVRGATPIVLGLTAIHGLLALVTLDAVRSGSTRLFWSVPTASVGVAVLLAGELRQARSDTREAAASAAPVADTDVEWVSTGRGR